MTVPPLVIIQARYGSTRLPGKMLLRLGGETLIERAWRIACAAFGEDNCVVAIPFIDTVSPLAVELDRIGARMIAWRGDESDVLGRFHHVAHRYRWRPDSVIVRYTPDDPFKFVGGLRAVAAGERLPVEIGGEAFTLAMLDAARAKWAPWRNETGLVVPHAVEHITYAIFPTEPPSAPPGVWTIDTAEDYHAAKAIVDERSATGTERGTWEAEICA